MFIRVVRKLISTSGVSPAFRFENLSESNAIRRLLLFILMITSGVVGSGCELVPAPPNLGEAGDSLVLYDNPVPIVPNPITDQSTVCDPFQNNPNYIGAHLNMGVTGDLFYLSDEQPRYGRSIDYALYGHRVPITLFLDQLNIPTRKFDLGFQTQTGDVIKNQNGNTLYEYFGVKLESELKLGPNDQPGNYQFAILSDDGAVLEMDRTQTQTYDVIINNDGVHPTRMGCAQTPVAMNATDSIPMRLHYYQGPRYHISLILMMREWSSDPSFQPNDPSCNQQGNSLFFDYNQVPSAPQQAYLNLLARGWKPLTSENYKLPKAITQNPCVVPEDLKTFITKFTPAGTVNTSADVSFEFTSNRPGATFECSLDGAPLTACSSPITYTNLMDGNHTFEVHAIDPQGNHDLIGASHSWRIDRIPPLLTFISTTNTSDSIQIDWTTSEPTTTLVQWGDTPAALNLVPENSSYDAVHQVLLQGLNSVTTYYFYVGGTDEAGNAFLSPRFSTVTRR